MKSGQVPYYGELTLSCREKGKRSRKSLKKDKRRSWEVAWFVYPEVLAGGAAPVQPPYTVTATSAVDSRQQSLVL